MGKWGGEGGGMVEFSSSFASFSGKSIKKRSTFFFQERERENTNLIVNFEDIFSENNNDTWE